MLNENWTYLLGDGLRHFAYMKERKFYNGVAQEDIHGEHKTNINGIQGTGRKRNTLTKAL